MSTFLRLAGLGTLIAGLQLVTPETSSATVINNHLGNFSSGARSNPVWRVYNNYTPPNNGAPKGANQGSGTR
ncbi:hypothetical protein ACE1CI_33050 [Aerosakkonemataceae cyanobacterium BLCC-F50]|uniref:Uncharacterized protein n=1 Tax=Floridaenema flaviceps BLCC-F50 TaxID=3153642 RepID=A0ABV4Y216_9CYAN